MIQIFPKLLVIIFALQLLGCSSLNTIKLSPLEFVETQVSSIATATGNVHYLIRYKLAENAPVDLYAQIQYQDLSNANLIRVTSIGSIGDAKTINFNGMPSDQIINGHNFEIKLILYKDADYNYPIGEHLDWVKFEMPATVAKILNITLL